MISDIDLLEMLAIEEARNNFWAYRQYINPKLRKGWWQREIAYHLQDFKEQLFTGMRPKLVIQAPPQFGKSSQVVDFISWISGHNPDLKTIYTSFSERLGVRANLKLQRIYDSPIYQKIFPNTSINKSNAVASAQHSRNREIIEYIGHEGYFRNTTVRGSITGETLDLGVVDDPIKGREEAGSITVRDKTWDWFMDDFFTRFSEEAGLLCILTRWHLDDPIGRLIKAMPEIKVLSYKAIATEDEPNRKEGESLFPEHKSLDFLMERKAAMYSGHWEALYQQNPVMEGGQIIKRMWFRYYKTPPLIKYRIVTSDTASKTRQHNDYSVLQCWGLGDDGKVYLLDMLRNKWEIPELERVAVSFWLKHLSIRDMGQLRTFYVEEAVSGTGIIQKIQRNGHIPIRGIIRTKDKLTRVGDVLSYIEAGLVCVPEEASFTNDFLAECENFTPDDTHQHDDQIDPMVDAINTMLADNAIRAWENF